MTPFGEGLWIVDGPIVTGAAGFPFPTRMAVVRLPDSGLWIWSPVALTAELKSKLAALGPIRHLVAPNSLHYMFLSQWADAFPAAHVYAAPGLTPKTAGTVIDQVLSDEPVPEWGDQIDHVIWRGNSITTEVMFYHRPSRTVLITDMVQQIPAELYYGWRSWVAALDLMTGKVPSVPRKFRIATRDRHAARAAVSRILDWPSQRLVLAHGPPYQTGAQELLRQSFRWLRV